VAAEPRKRGRPKKAADVPERRKPGTGSVRLHKPSGLWRATLPPSLDPTEHAYYFPMRAEAAAWLDGEIERRTVDPTRVSGRMTLGAYLRHFLQQESTSADWSPRTLESQGTNADYLRSLFDRSIDSITRVDLQPVVALLQTAMPREFTRQDGTVYTRCRPLTAGSLHNAVGTWRRAFQAAVDDELIPRNPCAKLTLPPLNATRAESWTVAEARKLVPALRGHRFEGVYALIFGCGLRISEARGLAWADVDWQRSRAWIHQGADGPRMLRRVKGRVGKWVTLLPPVVAALRRQHATQDWPAEYVSEWAPGVRVSRDTLVSDLKKLAVSVGVRPFPPHAGRHAVGNVLGAARIPLAVISDRLRHRSRTVTSDWYLEGDVDGEEQASQVLSDLFSGDNNRERGYRRGYSRRATR
jgi:integrase